MLVLRLIVGLSGIKVARSIYSALYFYPLLALLHLLLGGLICKFIICLVSTCLKFKCVSYFLSCFFSRFCLPIYNDCCLRRLLLISFCLPSKSGNFQIFLSCSPVNVSNLLFIKICVHFLCTAIWKVGAGKCPRLAKRWNHSLPLVSACLRDHFYHYQNGYSAQRFVITVACTATCSAVYYYC